MWCTSMRVRAFGHPQFGVGRGFGGLVVGQQFFKQFFARAQAGEADGNILLGLA